MNPLTPILLRLIPAWAGKTVTEFYNAAVVSAHPRVGGENTF